MRHLAARLDFHDKWIGSLEASTVQQAKRVFAALAEQGEVVSPFQAIGPTVSGGSVIDKFGKLWIVTCANSRGLLSDRP